MTVTATEVKKLDWRGDARLYKLSEPTTYEEWVETEDGDDWKKFQTHHVIVSAVDHEWARETFIFPATSDGKAINMTELYGSLSGVVSHEEAISAAGWKTKEEVDNEA